MDILSTFAPTLVEQLQKPTLAFLMGGMLLAAMGSKLRIPKPVYAFIVVVLLLKVGLGAGMAIRRADPLDLILPAIAAMALGVVIVLLGAWALTRGRGVRPVDGMATAGLFGAVSASTLAAGIAALEDNGMSYEGYIGALYPFMDVAALLTAIMLARLAEARQSVHVSGGAAAMGRGNLPNIGARGILVDTLRSPAISALILGIGIGLWAEPQSLYDDFYAPFFYGLLSLLMLIMGMDAWTRLSDLRGAAHAYLAYALVSPLVHGALGFGVGVALHHGVGFSLGGAVLLAVMAASSSDISGPPTLRAALPEANPSAYVGASTGLGTPIALLSIPLWIALAEGLGG
ncbi:MAG: sodium-dependent bicarbonate transport family permease [Pseudomonadota bacterium]